MSEVASYSLFIDVANRRLLSAPSSIQQAPEPKFYKGDISVVNVRVFAPAELTINPLAVVKVGVGYPGKDPLAWAILSDVLEGGKGRTGTLSLSNAAVFAALAASTSDTLRLQLEVELFDEDAQPKTLVRTPCTLYDVVLEGDSPAPAEVPTFPAPSEIALKSEVALRESLANKNQPNGYAGLDATGKLAPSQLPDLAISQYLGTAANQSAMLALTGQRGDWCVRSDDGKVYILNADTPALLASWTAISYPNQLQGNAVTNAILADMANGTLKGRSTAGTGDPEDLTGAQVNAMLPAATSALKGLVKQLTGPGYAPDDTSARGDDMRFVSRGGVACAGANVTNLSNLGGYFQSPVAMDSDREFWFNLTPDSVAWTTDASGMLFGSGPTNLQVAQQTLTVNDWGVAVDDTKIRLTVGTRLAPTHSNFTYTPAQPNGERWVGFKMVVTATSPNTVIALYYSTDLGDTWVSMGNLPDNPAAMTWCLGARSGVSGQYSGKVGWWFHTNMLFATAAKRKAALRGNFPSELVEATRVRPKGVIASGTGMSASNVVVAPGGDTAAINFRIARSGAAASSGAVNFQGIGGFFLAAGAQVRLRCKVTLVSGSAADLPRFVGADGNSINNPLSPANLAGDGVGVEQVVVATASAPAGNTGNGNLTPPVQIKLILQHHAGLYTNAGDVTYDVEVRSLEILGVSGIYPPDTVTESGRWCSVGRGCNDLLANRYIKPISPRAFVRSFRVTTGTHTITAGAAPAAVSIAPDIANDMRPLSCLETGDFVSAHGGPAEPASSLGLRANVTAQGTLSIVNAALGSNASWSGNTIVINHRPL